MWLTQIKRQTLMGLLGAALLISQAMPFIPEKPTLIYAGFALIAGTQILKVDQKRQNGSE